MMFSQRAIEMACMICAQLNGLESTEFDYECADVNIKQAVVRALLDNDLYPVDAFIEKELPRFVEANLFKQNLKVYEFRLPFIAALSEFIAYELGQALYSALPEYIANIKSASKISLAS